VRSITDIHAPGLPIVWEKSLEIARFDLPASAHVFAQERWTGAPIVAGMRLGRGAVLWLAVSPGERGYERFPFLLHALNGLGVDPGITSRRLWAFFDSSYRLRVDVDYFAQRWRKAGISALHVAAWRYNEPDRERDAYLRKLIDACHRRAILVYAWIELPHVSDRFWDEHPQWREKTATLQDAQLDWRKLMNLQNPECRNAVLKSTRALLERFNWDGVNLGELYFESLEGAANPARFTPFNDDVRRDFQTQFGSDPVSLVGGKSAAGLQQFLTYRADLARDMQHYWIGALELFRQDSRHDLDIVLTHVDDRFDTRMRDLIGADAAAALPLAEKHQITFLVEDPATVWHLGPERYPQIASRYRPLTHNTDRLAIDINIVERYQDVYPTKQQTGTELFQLVNAAARSFNRVALYFENSISRNDVALLAAAAAPLVRFEQVGMKTIVEAKDAVGVKWSGGAVVDGRPWPVADDTTVWLSGGAHVIEPAADALAFRILDFNGELRSALALPAGVEFSYDSQSRAFATLSAAPASVEIDGEKAEPELLPGNILVLPRGQHVVVVHSPLS
jgi:hypothetical protein